MVVKAFAIKKRDSGYDFGHVTVEDTPQSSAFVCDCFKLIVNLKGSIMICMLKGNLIALLHVVFLKIVYL